MDEKEIFEDDIEDDIEDIEEEEDIEEDIEDCDEDEVEDEVEDDLEEEEDELLNDLDNYINENENKEEVKNIEIKEKVTLPILTKYERNFVLGFRTQQIINGSVILIDINKLKNKTAYNIALEELKQKKIPFKIKRVLPNGNVEKWDIEEFITI